MIYTYTVDTVVPKFTSTITIKRWYCIALFCFNYHLRYHLSSNCSHHSPGKIDVVVIGAGSCGTLSGVARKVKEEIPGVKVRESAETFCSSCKSSFLFILLHIYFLSHASSKSMLV